MFSRPINVCHLGKYYPPAAGGIESHVQTLARAQAELGMQVRVVCTNHLGRDGHDVTWSRYGQTRTVEEFDGPVRVTRLGRSACVARFDIIPSLPKILLDLQYSPVDIVHLHTPNPTMLLTLAGLRINKPVVVTHHSDVVNQRILVHAMRPLERIVYGRAAAILSDSDGYIEGSAVLQRYIHKVATLPLGIDLRPYLHPSEEVLAAEERLRFRLGGEPLWLGVGRCVLYKGFHVAIAALPHVRGRLLVIGEGPMKQRLNADARRLGVSDRVMWAGHASDAELAAAYRVATALWFPSVLRSEGFGLVQVEAMASNCPVINTSIPGSGVSWVSQDGVSGLTVRPNDAIGLAAAANLLLNEPGLRQTLSRGARARAIAEFSHDRMASRSSEMYGRLLQTAQSSGRLIDAVEPVRPKLQQWVQHLAKRRTTDDTELHDTAAV